jgi:hypothetical protein
VDVQQNGGKATRSSCTSIEIPAADEAGSELAGAQPLLAAVAAVQAWEGEGGYTPQSDET